MKQFAKRLDRFIDLTVDTESLMGPKARLRPVPIKVIFDNLRLYTVLGLLWVGVKILKADPSWLAHVAAVTLQTSTAVLAFLVFWQTSLIALSAAFGAAAALLSPRTAVNFRRRIRSKSRFMWIAIAMFAFGVMGMAMLIAGALASALVRSGAI